MIGAAADEALAGRHDAPAGVDPKESARLNALRRYAILDSPSDASFNCITRMAARLLAMPVAAISLVDHERQWFKSCHGVELHETLRAGSLCGLAVLGDAVLEVPDARADPRFANSPLVTGPPHICFYAGAPLTTEDGHNLGALCVIDRTPRSLSSEERLLLLDLARIVVELIRLRSFSLDLRNEIAERERTEQALRASEQRFRDFAATASDWFWETDAEHRFIWMSANVAALTGVPRESQYGKTRFELMAPCTDPALIEAHRRDLEARQPFRDLEYVRRGPNGDFWLSTSGVPVFGDEGRFAGYRGVGREIGAKKRAEERLRHLAHHDDLTGLPNRYLLQDRLRQALALARRGGERVGLLLLDLDQFKEVNDALGHPVGDRVLRATAARLAAVVRASDTLARLGGDEFAVLQPSVQDAGAIGALADRLVGAFAAPFAVDGQEINVAASVGVAVSPDDGTDPDELVRRADMALYRAKHGGSGRFRFFEPAMDVEVRSRRELECELRRALDAAEFVLHYQPQVELATGRVAGVEALIRWQHPERGLVPPGEFVPVAEACGLILRLGAWVLGEACRQARAWQDAGTTLAIAVNLSPVQLRHGGVLQAIDDTLREHGLDGRWLEVELTESLLLELSEGATNRTLQGLATRGIRLTLDDFGTGYSSLAYLKRLPVQRIKIDRSFVCDVGTDPDHDAVVRAIVTLGHTLGKEVVAEGVETKAQLAFLHRLGCDSAQGFLLGRPQEAAQLTPLLAA